MPEKNIYKRLGTNLRKIRKAKKITQEELGKVIGVSKTAVVNYENGIRKIPLESVVKLCDFYDVSLDRMIEIKVSEDIAIVSNRPEIISFWQKWREEMGEQKFNDHEIRVLIDFAKFIVNNRSC